MKKISFLCFSFNNWDKRKARKQQFMLHLALREDVERVLYVEPPLNFFRLLVLPFSELKDRENRARWKRALQFKIVPLPESEKLQIFSPVFYIPFAQRIHSIYTINLYLTYLILRRKTRRLGFRNVVLWLYHPYDFNLLAWYKDRLVSVFDWAEDWAEFFSDYPARRRRFIAKAQQKVIKSVDVVFTVSRYLLERARGVNPRAYQIFDGTIPGLFSSYSAGAPEEIKKIPRPIIGYAGTVYRRFDMDLVAELSEALPDVSIVIVGRVLYPPSEIQIISKRKNVYLLGEKRYEELPAYMLHFDACILPYYAIDSTSPPTKIYDYLATGKPIVSIRIAELEKFKDCIRLARDTPEFIIQVREALLERNDALGQLRIKRARENSWEKRAQDIMEIIRDV